MFISESFGFVTAQWTLSSLPGLAYLALHNLNNLNNRVERI